MVSKLQKLADSMLWTSALSVTYVFATQSINVLNDALTVVAAVLYVAACGIYYVNDWKM